MTIPQLSEPLAKSIRTGEGLLIYATNVALVVIAALPSSLSWTHAALFLTIVNSVHAVNRTVLKVTALQKGLGIGAPIPAKLPTPQSLLNAVGLPSDAQEAADVPPQSLTDKPEAARTPDPPAPATS